MKDLSMFLWNEEFTDENNEDGDDINKFMEINCLMTSCMVDQTDCGMSFKAMAALFYGMFGC